MAFADEVMDRYGRLLAYLHPDQADQPAEQRKLSYKERLLEGGWVSPYFIWPNINPFRRAPSVTKAVPAPGTAAQLAERERSLRQARRWVQQARERHAGLYQQENPLRLLPSELRILARRQPPDRW